MPPKGCIFHCGVCGAQGHKRQFHNIKKDRRCIGCKQILPIEKFLRYIPKRYPGGTAQVSSRCCLCQNNYNRLYYRANFKNRFRMILGRTKHRAVKNSMACSIEINDIEELFRSQNGLCFYSGIELSLDSGDWSISIDRIDPEKGYIPGNIALTCWLINNMKRHLHHSEFILMCEKIFKWSKGGK